MSKTCFEPKTDEIFKTDAERNVASQNSRRCCAAARKRVADAAAPWRCRPAARKRVAFRQRTNAVGIAPLTASILREVNDFYF